MKDFTKTLEDAWQDAKNDCFYTLKAANGVARVEKLDATGLTVFEGKCGLVPKAEHPLSTKILTGLLIYTDSVSVGEHKIPKERFASVSGGMIIVNQLITVFPPSLQRTTIEYDVTKGRKYYVKNAELLRNLFPGCNADTPMTRNQIDLALDRYFALNGLKINLFKTKLDETMRRLLDVPDHVKYCRISVMFESLLKKKDVIKA